VEDMERMLGQSVWGSDPAAGEESQRTASPTVSQEEEPCN